MLKKLPYPLIVGCLAMLSASGFADTVVLLDGTKVEGKVTAETDTEVVIDEKISAGITDSRTIKKSEILSVTKEAPDEVAWQALKNMKVGPNSLPAASYDSVANALTNFTTQYPKSAHVADAEKIAAEFAADKKRVDGGEVKLDDKWLSKEEVQKERYQISALLALNYMKQQSATDTIGALNTFAAIEKTYPGARVYPDAIELAKTLLASLKTEVDRRIPIVTAQKLEQEKTIAAAVDPQRSEIRAAIKRDMDAADAVLTAADKQNLKWPPLIVSSDKSLQKLAGKIPSETSRLAALPIAKMRASITAAETARAAFEKQDLAATETSLKEATSAWSQNELATRLQTELTAAKALAKAAPAPVATPAPATPAKGRTAAANPTAPAPGDQEMAHDADKKPFLLTPAGAITVVVVVAFLIAALNAFKKIKAKANDVLE